jgi:hypothetical protein
MKGNPQDNGNTNIKHDPKDNANHNTNDNNDD